MTDSWVLKLNRAEHHLKEVDLYVSKYTDSHPYEAVPVKRKVDHKQVVGWFLRFTCQPDEMLPIVVGDVVHNIRSALDHLIVASLPKKLRRKSWACFPVFSSKPFDDDGEPLDTEDGKRWAQFAAAVPEAVRTQVAILQPYQIPPDPALVKFCEDKGISPADIHGVGLLNRLDNADKHRDLIALGQGLADTLVTITPEVGDPVSYTLPGAVPDGAEVARGEITDPTKSHEVKVEICGSARVAIEVRKDGGGVQIPSTLEGLIGHARAITTKLAPFARTD